jgi:hypothetical protein
MLKRTKGRLLLTLLVITGFAGTLNTTSLTKKERKIVVAQLKDSKADVLKSIRGLSDKQLNFKPSAGQWSIREHIYHLALAESGFWDMLEASMKKPATPEKRPGIRIADETLVEAMVTDHGCAAQFEPAKAKWKSVNQAVTVFKSSRSEHLKYVKTTTEDLRNHFIHLPSGVIDCYQFILFVSRHNEGHFQKIGEIMANPHFPAN